MWTTFRSTWLGSPRPSQTCCARSAAAVLPVHTSMRVSCYRIARQGALTWACCETLGLPLVPLLAIYAWQHIHQLVYSSFLCNHEACKPLSFTVQDSLASAMNEGAQRHQLDSVVRPPGVVAVLAHKLLHLHPLLRICPSAHDRVHSGLAAPTALALDLQEVDRMGRGGGRLYLKRHSVQKQKCTQGHGQGRLQELSATPQLTLSVTKVPPPTLAPTARSQAASSSARLRAAASICRKAVRCRGITPEPASWPACKYAFWKARCQKKGT